MTPYSDGYMAYRAGTPLNKNPYGLVYLNARGKAQRWEKGWKDAKLDDQQNKTRKLPKC